MAMASKEGTRYRGIIDGFWHKRNFRFGTFQMVRRFVKIPNTY